MQTCFLKLGTLIFTRRQVLALCNATCRQTDGWQTQKHAGNKTNKYISHEKPRKMRFSSPSFTS